MGRFGVWGKIVLDYPFTIWSLSSGGSQVLVLGRHPQLGRGAGGVRAVRRLAGQHRQCPGTELSHEVWSLQDRVVHGQVVLDWWYWCDDIWDMGLKSRKYLYTGHAPETPGVWTHSFDNSAVTWYPPMMTCGCSDHVPCYRGGDALLLSISANHLDWNGAWCDYDKTRGEYFICESMI